MQKKKRFGLSILKKIAFWAPMGVIVFWFLNAQFEVDWRYFRDCFSGDRDYVCTLFKNSDGTEPINTKEVEKLAGTYHLLLLKSLQEVTPEQQTEFLKLPPEAQREIIALVEDSNRFSPTESKIYDLLTIDQRKRLRSLPLTDQRQFLSLGKEGLGSINLERRLETFEKLSEYHQE